MQDPPHHRSSIRRTARSLRLVLALGLLLTACGASETDPDGLGGDAAGQQPRVADLAFDGEFFITSITVDDQPVEVATTARITLETEFGGLRVEPACNTFFGSFTIDQDGTASFTVTGGSSQDCGPFTGQEQAVLAALESVDSWVEIDGGFRFDGQSGASVSLTR